MIKIKVSPILVKQIERVFKKKKQEVFQLMNSLKDNPTKGDLITQIGAIQLREIRYSSVFRFYYLSNEQQIKILGEDELSLIIIKFEAMSKKGKEQQKVIDKIKKDLKKFGFEFF